MGPGKLVVFANAVEDNPLMAVPSTRMLVINVGGSRTRCRPIKTESSCASFDVLAETVKKTAFKITRKAIRQMASERLGVEFWDVDLFSRQRQLLGIYCFVSSKPWGLSQ